MFEIKKCFCFFLCSGVQDASNLIFLFATDKYLVLIQKSKFEKIHSTNKNKKMDYKTKKWITKQNKMQSKIEKYNKNVNTKIKYKYKKSVVSSLVFLGSCNPRSP